MMFCHIQSLKLQNCNHLIMQRAENQLQEWLWEHRLKCFPFFMQEMVFCCQNCSDLLWEKIDLVIEKKIWDHLNNLFRQWKVRTISGNRMLFSLFLEISQISKNRTIDSNNERSEQFLVTECFLACSWRCLVSNKLEQLKSKLEKIIGI